MLCGQSLFFVVVVVLVVGKNKIYSLEYPLQVASSFSFVNDANRKEILLASILYNNTSGWIMCFISICLAGNLRMLVYTALSLVE